jgi:ERF superfamily
MSTIAKAFVQAKKEFAPALKTSSNPHFRSKYADLSGCLEAVNDALLNAGIAVYQETSESDTGVVVETVFLHESGEMLRGGKLHVPAAKHDPQGYGSALTYARRYSLMAACGIAAEDDDGNAASRTKSRPNPLDKMSDTTPRSEAVSAYTLRLPQQEEPVSVHQSADAWVDAYAGLMKRVEDSAKIPDPRDKMTKLREIKEANEAVMDKLDVALKAKVTSDYQLRIRRLGAQQEK